jgi:uncharacterized iron-regulated membrane protein
VVGISTIIFVLLSITGIYLWWPRHWSWKSLKAVSVVNFKLSGKPRDWNWHNAMGLWSAPAIVIMGFTGIVMAFHDLGDWIYKRPEGEAAKALIPTVPTPPPGTRPANHDVLLAAAQKDVPGWETITLRLSNPRQRGGGMAATAAPQPINVTVKTEAWMPLPYQLQLDPFTGNVLQKESLSDYGLRRGFRTLNRTLHTGEAFGLPGQAVALFACIGGMVLVYTGFALSFRRFRNWRNRKHDTTAQAEQKSAAAERTAVAQPEPEVMSVPRTATE